MKKLLILALTAFTFVLNARADEGMWLLPMLKQNFGDMQKAGLKLTPEQIYSLNGNSLKDAIVIFGRGCTAEIVSQDGLLFTNHHCGYSDIQKLSSVENDYLKYGFWAKNRQEELPSPGLSVRFIRHIEDVTAEMLNGVKDKTTQSEREGIVKNNTQTVTEKYSKKYPGMSIVVKDFFGGNQFMVFAIEEYKDVRLVGTPPSSIGKFGGETDNWMWPRHTGDFCVFRVYMGKDGKPAEYSKDNVPYKAPVHLKVSLKGFEEGDYTMIMGFPGSTQRYMTSYELDQLMNVSNNNRIYIRGVRQQILWKAMEASDKIRIQYASKYAYSSNYWKNSIGKNRDLARLNVKAQKEELENRFTQWANGSKSRAKYRNALPLIKEAVEGRETYSKISQIIGETMSTSTEILTISTMQMSMKEGANVEKGLQVAQNFYKDYDSDLDRKVAKAMFKILTDSIPLNSMTPDVKAVFVDKYNSNINDYIDYVYDNSVFASYEKLEAYMKAGDFSKINEDPAVKLREWTYGVMIENRNKMEEYQVKFREGHRLFIAGLMEMEADKNHYPDANQTIRLTYGNIMPYSPADGILYDYRTTLSGVIAKEDNSNPMEFSIPDRLKELYANKDFGQYEFNGDVPVAFLSNNDITGGNSGSGILNDKGELIGLAFDGNWEAMSGDIKFNPALQRTISVDIRYVLFVIDKFAGAGYLLDEMTIVR